MSHYTRVRTTLQDQRMLVRALNKLGFAHVESHDEPMALYGYEGDRRSQTAEVIIRRVHVGEVSNDIGFVRAHDGTFHAVISDYDRTRFDAAWLRRLTQTYGHETARSFAEERGYDILAEESDEAGNIRLTLRRTAL
jgi:Protein of unknown function (DUF1257)